MHLYNKIALIHQLINANLMKKKIKCFLRKKTYDLKKRLNELTSKNIRFGTH